MSSLGPATMALASIEKTSFVPKKASPFVSSPQVLLEISDNGYESFPVIDWEEEEVSIVSEISRWKIQLQIHLSNSQLGVIMRSPAFQEGLYRLETEDRSR
jgi:hypothetical protein